MTTTRIPGAETPQTRAPIGWALSALCIVMLTASAAIKLFAPPEMLASASRTFGFPVPMLPWLALLELGCTLLYAVPRTSVLGAVLLTGYLGGAVATHTRLSDAALLVPIVLGLVAWAGVYLREPRLRALAPLVRPGA